MGALDDIKILPRMRKMAKAETAEEAVRIGYDLGMPNDAVLLSPACASFDLFGSYEERGNKFKQAVRGL